LTTQDHIRFQALCALAPTGQLDCSEQADLKQHLQQCVSCSDRLFAMTEISGRLLLTPSRRHSSRISEGMLERFESRAVREGVPLRRHSPPASSRLNPSAFASMALLGLLILTLAHRTSFIPVGHESFYMPPAQTLPIQQTVRSEGAKQTLLPVKLNIVNRARHSPNRLSLSRQHEGTSLAQSSLPAGFPLYSPLIVTRWVQPSLSLDLDRNVHPLSSDYSLPGLGLHGSADDRSSNIALSWNQADPGSGPQRFRYSARIASLVSIDFPRSRR